MKRLLLDTNVILRLFAADPAEHHAAAVLLFERAERGEVELELRALIVAEAVYVLQSVYGVSRAQIAEALSRLVAMPSLQAGERPALVDALARYATGGLSFADCYLAATAAAEDAGIVTFDAGLHRLKSITTVDPQDL